MKRLALALLGIGALGAAAFYVVAMRPLPVAVAQRADDVPIQVFGLGTVEARILSRIGFEVGAALVELNADHGDRIAKGDVLARLHDREQVARVARAAAGVLNAEAAVNRAEAGIGRARAVLAQKRQANERKQALLKQATVSVEAAEEAQLEQEVAAAELAVAISEGGLARAAQEDARAQHEFERVLLEHHVLHAPFDALVVERHKELGAVLAPGELLFTLVDPATVWVLAYVDESRAGQIRTGQPAEVRMRSLPRQTFQGRVARIGIESDRVSEERRVYVTCERCPPRFHLGEQAEVVITTDVLGQALLVPEVAVDGFDGSEGRVWVVEQGALRRRTLGFGQRTLDARLEVVAGLPDDAYVVSAPRPGLREGRAARPVEATAQ